MKKSFILLSIFCLSFSVAPAQKYEVKVHPGTELMHIVNYLAGVYQPAMDTSTYLKDVNQWFGKFRDHPAVVKASELPYNDFVDLGWCIEFPSKKLSFPEEYAHFSLLKSRSYLKEYLRLSHQFAIETDFWEFYQQQSSNYNKWEQQFASALERDQPLEVLDDFYQLPIDKKFFFSISPMGVVLRANIYLEQIAPAYGHLAPILIPFDRRYIEKDSEEPFFLYNSISVNNNVWHEASHIYWEELNGDYKESLLNLKYQDALSRQINVFEDNRLNLYFYIHEVVSDGVAIYLKKKLISEEAAEKHLLMNEQAGSPLYRRVVDLFEIYWSERSQRDFKAFIPEIINLMNE